MSVQTKRLKIGGMTCQSCQNRIERKLRNATGVKSVSVSYSAGRADISYDADIVSLQDICGVIEKLNYRVLTKPGSSEMKPGLVAAILIAIAALYVLLQQFGILNLLVPGSLADTKTSYVMIFVIGLLTSVHCIAMCGGINLSQSVPRSALPSEKKSRLTDFKPAFLYNLGRVISYTFIGAVLGFAGFLFGGGASDTGLPVTMQGVLKLIAGAVMVIMGINMLGLFPLLRKMQLRLPKFITGKTDPESHGSRSPLFVGLLNGLLPCGPLQSMQIVALASGNPFAGALSMFLFSMGTVPLMLGLGAVVSALGRKFASKVMTIGAVLVVVFGLAMLSQGSSLSGLLSSDKLIAIIIGLCAVGIVSVIPYKKSSYRAVSSISVACLALAVVFTLNTWMPQGGLKPMLSAEKEGNGIEGEKQIVNSTLTVGSFPDITVEAGTPVKWTITAPDGSINGCNSRMNILEYGISDYAFEPGENVIEFTPTEPGSFQYSCWMGMIRGSITVI